MVKKYDIVLVQLEPTRGAEKRGIRPCLVLQNNLANASHLQTVTLAPLTAHVRNFSSMQKVEPNAGNGLEKDSGVDLSQIRTVDRGRIHKTIGHLEPLYYSSINEKITDFLDLRDEYL